MIIMITFKLNYYNISSVQGGSAEIELRTGDTLTLTIEEEYEEAGDKNIIYVDYKNIIKVRYVSIN